MLVTGEAVPAYMELTLYWGRQSNTRLWECITGKPNLVLLEGETLKLRLALKHGRTWYKDPKEGSCGKNVSEQLWTDVLLPPRSPSYASCLLSTAPGL